jgi:hypothetical protein
MRPKYYKLKIEPISYILENGLPFCEGNVVKYISRWKQKDGIKDLYKAKQYIEFLIEQEETKVIGQIKIPGWPRAVKYTAKDVLK